MSIVNIQVGADPEVFLYDEEDDLYVPAIDLVGGTKEEPKPIGDNHYVQEDNVMAEFNIPPCNSADEFVECMHYAMNGIKDIIPNPLQLMSIPSAKFEEHFLTDPRANVAGCDPYRNAWNDGEMEETVELDTNDRYAGGHLHISFNNPTEQQRINLVKSLDLFCGVPSIVLDKDKIRRKTYGKAGAYRRKDYGVEYRSLSNFWLSSDKLIRWVYNNVQEAISFTNHGGKVPNKVPRIINGSFEDKAEKIINEYEIPMP